MSDAEAVIRTAALSKTYDTGVQAVDDLHLAVHAGEIFGLLGPNGAGKSTTIGMLTTRVIPTGGTAVVGGVDVIHHPALAKQVIGVVPQTNTLDRAMSVLDNLVYHGRYFGMNTRDAKLAGAKMLETVRLSQWAKAPVGSLSGGMAQRLMVARAILHRPQILFLDEPTSGLDPQSRLALWDILQELHAEGQTILLTTHYMEEADQLCDRVAIMDHGEILALDTPERLKRSVGVGNVVQITAAGDLDRLAEHLVKAVPTATSAQVIDNQVRLQADGSGLLPRIVAAAEEAGASVTDI